jgi:hypothetical protein
MRDWMRALLAAMLALAVATSTAAPAYQPPAGWSTITLADGALD